MTTQGYDGSIRIDTSVSTAGMAKGTKSISASLSGVMRSLKGVAALIGVVFSAAAIGNFVKSTVASFNFMGTEFGNTIKQLKDSFAQFKSALTNSVIAALTALAPYIIIAVNWLTTLLTTVTQVIAALFGVQSAMGGVTDATQEAGQEAKNKLASFDQLNVLAKDTPAEDSGPVLPPVTVPPEILAKVEEFKTKLLEFLQPITDAFDKLKIALEPLGKTIWDGLVWAWDHILVPLGTWVANELLPEFLELLASGSDVLNESLIALQPTWQEFFDKFLKPLAEWTGGKIIEFLDWLTLRLDELAVWIKENPEKFSNFVNVVLALAAAIWLINAAITVGSTVMAIWSGIVGIATLVTTGFGIAMAFLLSPIGLVLLLLVALGVLIYLLITRWEELKTTVEQILFILGYYISTYFLNPLLNGFGKALDWISDKFTIIFGGIKDFVKWIINGIIGFINGMIDSVIGGINSIVKASNLIGNIIPGYSPIPLLESPQIPHLAKGSIIPPNAQFAAILGDQKSGVNIETPVSLMKETFEDSLSKALANQNVTINFTGSAAELVRLLRPEIVRENNRVGGSLIKSVVS